MIVCGTRHTWCVCCAASFLSHPIHVATPSPSTHHRNTIPAGRTHFTAQQSLSAIDTICLAARHSRIMVKRTANDVILVKVCFIIIIFGYSESLCVRFGALDTTHLPGCDK